MKARSAPVLMAGIMSGVALGLVCVTAALLWEGWSLRRQLLGTAVEAAQLRSQQTAARDDLEAQRAELAALTAEVERLRQAASVAPDGDATPASARRARVYLGNRMVGSGWVVTAPPGADAEGQPAPALASVMLDPPPAGTASGAAPAAEQSSGAPAPERWSYHYQQSSPYWYWPYLYTTGWIEWPDCTNGTDRVGAMPFAPQPSPASTATTAAAPSTTSPRPAPTVVSQPSVGPSQIRARFPQTAPVANFTRPVAGASPRNLAPSTLGSVATVSAPRGSPLSSAPAVRRTIPAPGRATVGTRR